MSRLPAGLEAWGPTLQCLEPDLVEGLAPLLRSVDTLLRRTEARADATGEPDGYDGLAARGTPERLLTSEWLLAQEAPEEFLRRAAMRELTYLSLARTRPHSPAEVVALVDAGPQQHGVPRLVQLAVLMVLHRRATGDGYALRMGVLGDEPDRWLTGDLGGILTAWRRAQYPRRPTPDDLLRRLDTLEPAAGDAWLLCGPALAAAVGPRSGVRTARIEEGAWGPAGVTDAVVIVDGDRAVLPVPSAAVAVRALRSARFRMEGMAERPAATGLGEPVFASLSSHLVMRGGDDHTIVTTNAGRLDGPLFPTSFPGRVVAAARLGRRTLALTLEGERLRVRHVGRRMGGLHEIEAAFDSLPAGSADTLGSSALQPLYVLAGSVAFRVGDEPVRLESPDLRSHFPGAPLAIGPSDQLDSPRMVFENDTGVWLDGQAVDQVPRYRHAVLGQGVHAALSVDGVTWDVFTRGHRTGVSVTVPERDEVLGVLSHDHHALLTRSRAGVLLRVVTARGHRTLTGLSAPLSRPALHPRLPLLAVEQEPGRVVVAHPGTGEIVRVVRAS